MPKYQEVTFLTRAGDTLVRRFEWSEPHELRADIQGSYDVAEFVSIVDVDTLEGFVDENDDVIAEQSDEYRAAYLAHEAAFAVYTPIRDAYRAVAISDADYLEARAVWVAAGETFDAAFAKEWNND